LGLNMTTALNVFLRKTVDESAIPFPISVRDSGIGHGYSPSDVTEAFGAAVEDKIAESKSKGLPIARYDLEKKQAYIEATDGSRMYVNG